MRSYTLLTLLLAFSSVAAAEPVRTKHVTAELLLENKSLQAGSAGDELNWIGLRLEMAPHWHTYWRFPGDSGLPTEVIWKLPPGWKVTPAYWQLPQRIFVPPLVNFGYENSTVIGYKLQVPSEESEGTKRIHAEASWLVCKEECIPEKGELTLDVKVSRGVPVAATFSRYFSELRTQQPNSLPEALSTNIIYREKELGVEVAGLHASRQELKGSDFLPLTPQVVKGDSLPKIEIGSGKVTFWLDKSEPFDKKVASLSGMLLLGEKGRKGIHELEMPLPKGVPMGEVATSNVSNRPAPSNWLLILFALLGGMILNLMPCVFPVLGIKVMSLVKKADGDPKHARRHGHAYALGVVSSFWILAGGLLILRSAGESVGWGFQLQHPGFVTFLIFLFSLVAADLAGFINWSGRWMGVGSSLAGREGVSGSFFTGVLAVVVATPCTAPFMGTAIGAAISEPGWVFFLVFSFLGIGLALPFVLLCYQPRFLKALPKPGVWMERLKELFAIPIVATIIWLLWVLTQQIGADGALWVELGLLIVMISVWIRRRFQGRFALFMGWALLAAGILVAANGTRMKAPASASAINGPWVPYSENALAEALELGKPVFVDFTAAWCLTCQINKKLVLDREPVLSYLKEKEVVLLLADWTNRDPEITSALERQGRIGVPMYLAYSKGSRLPVVLPQVLTESALREAFP